MIETRPRLLLFPNLVLDFFVTRISQPQEDSKPLSSALRHERRDEDHMTMESYRRTHQLFRL